VAAIQADPGGGIWPLTVRFDGSGSADPTGGALAAHRWDFGDGSEGASGVSVEHVFGTEGSFRVVLTVTAGDGREATAETFISVSAPPCPQLSPARVSGTLTSEILDEVSGMVASRVHSDVFWLHNDSGDGPRVYAVDVRGRLLGGWELPVTAYDWEDIAIGPGPADGVPYIYVGDIGDNDRQSPVALVHRFPEPAPPQNVDPPLLYRAQNVDTLTLAYPGGQAFNAEALMVDPHNGDLYLATKGRRSRIFRAAAPLISGPAIDLVQVAEVNLTEVTGGDISPDGREIVLRTYQRAFSWPRAPGQELSIAMGRPACVLDIAAENQGESITFDLDGRALFTVGEGLGQSIFRSERL
jgi:PKD repeat protein